MKSVNFLKSDGLDKRVLCEGGGCLSIFGLPFLAAGIFMLLGAAGIVPIKNEDGTPAETWGMVVFFFMGLVFSCVGGGLVFGRQRIVIDRAQGTLDKEWTAIFSLKKEKKRLRAFKEVAIKFDRGDSDTSDRYPVVLSGPDDEVSVFSPIQFGEAREMALALSEFLHLPLQDKTTDHVKVYTPEESPELSVVHRPHNMRSRVNETPEALEIFMPQSHGLGCAAIMMIVPFLFVFEFFPPLHRFWDFSFDIHNPGDVFGAFFFGMFFLFAVLVPLSFVLRVLFRRKDLGASIKIAPHALEIRDIFSQTKTKTIPFGDILSIERTRAKDAQDFMKDNKALGGAKPFQPAYEKRKKTAEKTFAFFSKIGLGVGGKIILKTKTEIIETGLGLSGEELDYLCHLIAKRIGARKGP